MAKSENAYKAKVVQLLRAAEPSFVIFATQDVRTAGIPDLSVEGRGRCTRWEFKRATPTFQNRGIQLRTCQLLAVANYCRYIIYLEYVSISRTMIVHPALMPEMGLRSGLGLACEATIDRIDHRWVTEFIRAQHQQ